MQKKLFILGLILGMLLLLISAKPLFSPGGRLAQPESGFKLNDKTYINDKYNFQIAIPADWQMEEWDIEEAANLKSVPDGTILYQGKFFGESGHFEILIWQNKQSFSSNNGQVSTRNWLTWFRHEDLILESLPKEENFSLTGIPAVRYLQQKTSRKKPVLYVFFGKNNKIYELTEEREDLVGLEATQSARFSHPVYDKILQSFKLVVR